LLVTLPSLHPGALSRLSTSKVLQTRERVPTLYPFNVFTFGFIIEFIKEFGSASKKVCDGLELLFYFLKKYEKKK
jgi:hypothetical protein